MPNSNKKGQQKPVQEKKDDRRLNESTQRDARDKKNGGGNGTGTGKGMKGI